MKVKIADILKRHVEGHRRWRWLTDLWYIALVLLLLCIGEAGLLAAVGTAGVAAIITFSVFLMFVLPLLSRSEQAK